MQDALTLKLNSAPEDKWLVATGLILSLVTAFWLVKGTITEVSIDGTPAVGQLKVQGAVKRRHARSLHWGAIEGHGVIYLRDTVYVPKDTRAEISWGENQSIILEADSMVQFDEVSLDTIRIVLIDGATTIRRTVKKSAAPSVVRALPTKPKEIFRIMPYPKTSELAVFMDESGELIRRQRQLGERLQNLVTRGPAVLPEATVIVPSLDLRSVDDFRIRLITPTNTEYDLRSNPWLRFSWSEIPLSGTNYRVDIARDKNFRRLLSHQTTKTELSIQAQDTGAYFWRVTATRGAEKSISNLGTFSMVRTKGTDVFKQRVVNTGPTGFVWEISTKKFFPYVLKNGVAPTPTCVTTDLKAGRYFCRIRDITSNQILKEYALTAP